MHDISSNLGGAQYQSVSGQYMHSAKHCSDESLRCFSLVYFSLFQPPHFLSLSNSHFAFESFRILQVTTVRFPFFAVAIFGFDQNFFTSLSRFSSMSVA